MDQSSPWQVQDSLTPWQSFLADACRMGPFRSLCGARLPLLLNSMLLSRILWRASSTLGFEFWVHCTQTSFFTGIEVRNTQHAPNGFEDSSGPITWVDFSTLHEFVGPKTLRV